MTIGQFAPVRTVDTLFTLFAMDTKYTQVDSPRKTYRVEANLIDGLVQTYKPPLIKTHICSFANRQQVGVVWEVSSPPNTLPEWIFNQTRYSMPTSVIFITEAMSPKKPRVVVGKKIFKHSWNTLTCTRRAALIYFHESRGGMGLWHYNLFQ